MNLHHFVQTIDYVKWLFSRVFQNGERIHLTCFLIKTNNFVLFVCLLGCSRKNPHPHPKDGILEILAEWGGQRPWKSRWERGQNSKKSSAGVISTNSSRLLNVQFGDILALSDPENSRSILFTYISPDRNDNLSSFAGPFIAENANKILKTVTTLLQQRICNARHIFTRTQTQPTTVE